MVAAKLSADAMKDVADQQIQALERQRAFVYENLDPKKIGPLAEKADIANAKARLELQKQLDPDLYAARFEAEKAIRDQLKRIGVTSDKVADRAVEEALAGTDTAAQGKQALIDAALEQLKLGATLPPDVQAELVKAGLEKGGMVTGSASGKGFGGQLTRQLLGSAGIALQQQRQSQAAGLLGQAQNLESARASLLGTLFPNLAATQLNNLAGAQGALQTSNAIMAPVGLSGGDVTNLWLARVGATTNIAREGAQAGYLAGMNQIGVWNKAAGQALPYAVNALPTTSQYFQSKPSNAGAWGGAAAGAGAGAAAGSGAAAGAVGGAAAGAYF